MLATFPVYVILLDLITLKCQLGSLETTK